MMYKGRIEGRILWVRVCTISSEKYICPQRPVIQHKLHVEASINTQYRKEETNVRES